MRIIAFITHSADIRQILDHIGVDSEPPHISPARGPPLWDDCDAQVGEGVQVEPDWATDWDGAAQPAPDFDADQRVTWRVGNAAILTCCGEQLRKRQTACRRETQGVTNQAFGQFKPPNFGAF